MIRNDDDLPGPPGPEYRHYVGEVGAGDVTLADVLDRVLERGMVVDGEVNIDVGGIRRLVAVRFQWVACSIERAEELGIDWWPDAPS